MTTTAQILRCTGRPVDQALQPVGDECGRIYRGHLVATPGLCGLYGEFGPPTAAQLATQARVKGWGVLVLADGTTTATCPSCRRPDPTTVAACRDLTKETHRP
jgi:hypothetical protein